MKLKTISKNPRIILLANDRVGLAAAKYLKQKGERIAALVLHSKGKAKLAEEIRAVFPTVPVFYADRIREPKTLSRLAALRIEIGISAWFGYILKKEFINLFPAGIINFHNSYLPVNRGKYPHVWALATGSIYGVTLHYVDEGIDTGAIIAHRVIRAAPTDTAGLLYARALDEIVDLFKVIWPRFRANKIRPLTQKGKATHHFAREVAELDYIDLSKKYIGEDLINQLRSRSFKDRSYAYFVKNGKKIYVKVELSEKPEFR